MDERSQSEAALADAIDLAGRRLMTGLMVAGAAIGVGLYAQPGPPRYQVEVTDTGIVRVDTRRGTVIACEGQRCHTVVRRGQRLERRATPESPAAVEAPKQPEALPAPEAAPAPANGQ